MGDGGAAPRAALGSLLVDGRARDCNKATRGWTLPKWTTLVIFFSGPRRQAFFFFFHAQGDRVFFFFFSCPRRQGFFFFFSCPRRQGFFFFLAQGDRAFIFFSWPKETGLFFFFWPKETGLFFFFFTWTRIRLCLRNLPFVVQVVQTPLHHARQALQVGYIGHCLTGP